MTQRLFIAGLLAAFCACSGDDDTAGPDSAGSGGAGDGAEHPGTGGAAVTSGSGGKRMAAESADASTTAGHPMTDAGRVRDGGAPDARAQGATIDCGADAAPNPIDDPSSFSGIHVAAIVYDCTQVSNCNQQRDLETSNNSLPACACQVATILTDTQRQMSFLTKYTRCQQFMACEYVTCVQTSGAGQ